MTSTADRLLTELRTVADRNPYTHSSHSSRHLASLFRDLDAHLSAGGTPPEAWREGPDAPEVDDQDDVYARDDDTSEPPAGMVQDDAYARDDR